MCSIVIILVVIAVLGHFQSVTGAENCTIHAKGNSKFPDNFSFGVATSAYQIEGAWNADGKGPSIWDEYTHKHPDRIKDKSNGDIAAESYHHFDLDLKALKDLKVDHYRFSIAWTRIFPNGCVSSRNQKGIDYYNSVINKLLENGIEPMVTMYHWDLPAELQKFGGFTNSLIVEQFLMYADELFESFGDRVKTWITFNEPNQVCKFGYGTGSVAPMVELPGVGDYLCYTNLLKAHGATYRLYRSKFFEKQQGKIGITLDSIYGVSKTNNNVDVDRAMQYTLGLLAHPIFSKSGGFPPLLVKDVQKNSFAEGRKKSRLPNLDEYWKALIRGSADFLGINYYTSKYVKRSTDLMGESPSMARDYNVEETFDPKWLVAKSEWLHCYPEGLEGLLKFIRDEYDNVEVKITENGWSDEGELVDENRVLYFKSHIQAVLNAIHDGSNISSYSAWSLVDNFEWNKGYTEKFGLYSVNMKSHKKERIPKKSAHYYRKVIETRTIPNEDFV
ncbi:myrosinase 1-like [Episyrphus balteatus]|uniref:myrosinase 1-like n=1 Tax=Episyrphus balteatus TaxID=286459 RepID=UPI002485A696|nr:myrosinase 1-like [Episyrphus balteatus]